MEVQFKITDQPISSYNYFPYTGEILIYTKGKYSEILTRDNANSSVSLLHGWDAVYADYYYVCELSNLEDVNLSGLLNTQNLIYDNTIDSQWVNSDYNYTSLGTDFYDVDLTRYEGLSELTTPTVNDTLRARRTFYSINYATRSPAGAPSSGSWSLYTSGNDIILALSRYDINGVDVKNTLRAMVASSPYFSVIVEGVTYNIIAPARDILDSSNRIEFYVSTSLIPTGIFSVNNIPFSPLTFSVFNEFYIDKKQPILSLPDGGNFNDQIQPVIAYAPDGGLLETAPPYLYNIYAGYSTFRPLLPGSFANSSFTTDILSLNRFTADQETFNVNDFGGLGGTIPAPGMLITVYKGGTFNNYYITSYSGTSTWGVSNGYFSIRTNQDLYTIFGSDNVNNYASAIQIHRPSGSSYRWVT